MIHHLKAFFYPLPLTYSYNKSKDIVLAAINEVLNRKMTLTSSQDIKGSFLNNSRFRIEASQIACTSAAKLYATLVGEVIALENGTTQIILIVRPRSAFYFLFITTIILGFVYLCKFIGAGSADFLHWSLAMLILGPALSVGFSNVAVAAIRRQYDIYIDIELTK